MKRLLVAVLLVIATVVATPGTASAHLHYITFDETAVITDEQARVTGVIECHLGWVHSITVRLENADGYLVRGNLGGRPICTTEPQPFEITVNGHFSEGPAAITVTAHGGTKSQGILHSLTTTGTVELEAAGAAL